MLEIESPSTASRLVSDIRAAGTLFLRPQRVTLPMVMLFAIIPFYLVIGSIVSHGPTHRPDSSLDALFPLTPATLYTKQHYVADVLAGAALAFTISYLFLRTYAREATPTEERRLAPVLATGAFLVYGLGISALWI